MENLSATLLNTTILFPTNCVSSIIKCSTTGKRMRNRHDVVSGQEGEKVAVDLVTGVLRQVRDWN